MPLPNSGTTELRRHLLEQLQKKELAFCAIKRIKLHFTKDIDWPIWFVGFYIPKSAAILRDAVLEVSGTFDHLELFNVHWQMRSSQKYEPIVLFSSLHIKANIIS